MESRMIMRQKNIYIFCIKYVLGALYVCPRKPPPKKLNFSTNDWRNKTVILSWKWRFLISAIINCPSFVVQNYEVVCDCEIWLNIYVKLIPTFAYGEVPPRNSAVGGGGDRWGVVGSRARCSLLSLRSVADSSGRVATLGFSARKTLFENCL